MDAAVSDPLVYTGADRLEFALRAVDISTRATPPNLTVRACLITDPACERPITNALSADAEGIVHVPLTVGVSCFLEIQGDGIAPSLLVFPGPLSEDLARLLESRAVVVVPRESPESAPIPIRTQATPDTGTLLVTVYDCAGRGAAGVRLELNGPAVPFSIVDGLPIMNQNTTTTYATAGFINVEPGVSVVSGYRVDSGGFIGQDAVLIRAGWDTLANMLPEPHVSP